MHLQGKPHTCNRIRLNSRVPLTSFLVSGFQTSSLLKNLRSPFDEAQGERQLL